ncbi:MAG: hypothetical protein JW904_02595 [Spirochaetales bacterium]|nr:hypothetical protein [Spirochaetales bacterium]
MENTRKHIITGYVLFSLFFLAGIFGYGLFRINSNTIEKAHEIEKTMELFKTNLEKEFGLSGAIDSPAVDKLFLEYLEKKDAHILVLVVYSQDSKNAAILKAKGKSARYLENSRTTNWDAKPDYDTPFGTNVFELKANLGYQTRNLPVRIGAVYVNFSVQNLHSLMWEIFYIFLGYFVLTFIMIIFLGLVFQNTEPAVIHELPLQTEQVHSPSFDQFHDSFEDDFSFPDLGPPPRFDVEPGLSGSPLPIEQEIFNDDYKNDFTPVGSSETQKTSDSLYNKNTGFVKAMFFRERLGAELERAASFDQDLSLVFISLNLGQVHDDQLMALSSVVHNFFTFHDLSFEYGNNIIACIVPDEDIDLATKTCGEFKNAGNTKGFATSIGIASRNGRILSPDSLIGEAEAALKKAMNAGENKIVAFRIDPEKYRNANG